MTHFKCFCKFKIKTQLFVTETCSEHFQRSTLLLKALKSASLNVCLKRAHSGVVLGGGRSVLYYPHGKRAELQQ